ncbi:hypothetical protein CK203_095970 [Vitis vinifera]|uniref:Uncharacterized protein n=1 Tax=Vitis vinifera TaxID=29760 RepID=A0A438CRU4_VITVI|nr:hypothetical protein CK203_095970 [Vitis vinifera]
MPKVPQESSKLKGSSVSVRRKARSWPPRLEEASSTPKRNLEGGGSSRQIKTLFEANLFPVRAIFLLVQKHPKFLSARQRETRGFRNANWLISQALAVQCGSFFISPVVDLSRCGGASCSEGVAFSLETSNRKFKDRPFLRETLSNPKERGVSGEPSTPKLKPSTFPLEGFQVEGLTPRKMVKKFGVGCSSSLWGFGGIVILWDSIKFKCTEKVLGSFSVTVKLNSDEEGSFWLTSVCCVGGDFNVIRRISEKMGDSRLTVNMRCFDEFIRESGLLDPPRRNTAFTWSNMQVDPICKRLDRLRICGCSHPEFKEKFRDWWQECMVEGWEGDSWKIEGIDWAPISGESAVWLDRPFSEEEVRMAVFQLNKEKAPGPDGFTIAVYQECWDVIKEDLMRVFFEFHTKGSLCGRETNLDAVLIANEVVDEKRRKGFSQKWRSWMRGCLSSSSFAILVNGNAKGWVKASRGLPLGGNPKTIGFWDPVVERISRRLDGWKKAYLSLGGRITLIQSCLSHIPSYFLSLFKIPVSIASKIEKMQRDFLWSGAGKGRKITLSDGRLLVDQRSWEVWALGRLL